ncbi:MAG: DUF4398 domain-containing protein [Deltaproteobacteria bacterium]|nr:DUF4398 domain-containing protein [Deltaproteobacteria bacterium]
MTARGALSAGLVLLLAAPAMADAPDGGPAGTVVLEKDQILEDLAQQLFESREAADELRAINGIEQGAQPAPGQALKLPGPERRPAVSALHVCEQAVRKARQADAEEYAMERLEQALASLAKARSACQRAQYARCQTLADETWALARMARQESETKRSRRNRFAVSVHDGDTRVEVSEGDGIEVSAQKRSTTVPRGHSTRVKAGKAPDKPQPLPDPPEQVLPFPDSVLTTPSIHFHWRAADRAARYVLLIARDPGGRKPVRQLTTGETTYLFRSSLSDGEYYWFLRSVDSEGAVGSASPPRRFQLQSQGTGVTVEDADVVKDKP